MSNSHFVRWLIPSVSACDAVHRGPGIRHALEVSAIRHRHARAGIVGKLPHISFIDDRINRLVSVGAASILMTM